MDVLRTIKNKMKSDLDLQEIINKCSSLNNYCANKDGSGLSSGTLVEYYLNDYIRKIPGFEIHNVGESDIKINDVCLSLKKINGKSTIALDWSKNKTSSTRTYFNHDIMIINLKDQIWWKKSPINPKFADVQYSINIPAGIYLIDKEFCKRSIVLSSNNKTNTLIDSENLYIMLLNSMHNDLVIEFPKPDTINVCNVDFTKIFG